VASTMGGRGGGPPFLFFCALNAIAVHGPADGIRGNPHRIRAAADLPLLCKLAAELGKAPAALVLELMTPSCWRGCGATEALATGRMRAGPAHSRAMARRERSAGVRAGRDKAATSSTSWKP
jgi:hypothetical protein